MEGGAGDGVCVGDSAMKRECSRRKDRLVGVEGSQEQPNPPTPPPAGTSAVHTGLGYCWHLTSLSFQGT